MRKEKLYAIRKQKGFTQKDIADILGIDTSNYNRKENGSVKISKDDWKKIAKFLKVPVEEIYDDKYTSKKSMENREDYIIILEKENKELRTKLDNILKIIAL
ncbi:helix-turn-helix transcriptional regulator [Chryseobacterium flavum]|uniref:helix-turn-helix transcriptional regulator n=1 Tax=Chryseobacterium flavum TaxID=415851 RepID=UPI002FDB302E